jgi:TetR/AcrR family transcriptional regulator, regulator of biofilm formation and stress response
MHIPIYETNAMVKKGLAKKAQLVDATMKLISQSGVAAVTQRAVAAAAGLPPSAVTYHFDTVDGLLIEALVSVNDRYVTALRSLPDDPDAALVQLAEYISASTTAYREDVIAEYEVYLMASRRQDLRHELGRWLNAVDEFAARFTAEPVDRLAFVSTVEGLFFRAVTAEQPISAEDALAVLQRVALFDSGPTAQALPKPAP